MPPTARVTDAVTLASQLDEPIVVVDVGCRWGFADAWTALGRRAVVIGFDPDPDECRRLQAQYRDAEADVRLVPLGLGATTGPARLHVTVFPACSSLYPPEPTALARHPGLAILDVDRAEQVDLVTLDDWMVANGLDHVDVLKLDTQGSELAILQGAASALATVRMIEVEVEFNRLYAEQPLFGDVDAHLRRHGFELWRLAHLTHYGFAREDIHVEIPDHQDYVGGVGESDVHRRAPFVAGGGQLYFADAFYIRSDMLTSPALGPVSWQGALRDACVAAGCGFPDLADIALARAELTA